MSEVFKCDGCGEIGGYPASCVEYFSKDGTGSGSDDLCVRCRKRLCDFLNNLQPVQRKKSTKT